ncbi:MAG: hypothetical protein ACI9R3_006301 [Verrucomicrobiales bacterium]|jgi:hypothetical protein
MSLSCEFRSTVVAVAALNPMKLKNPMGRSLITAMVGVILLMVAMVATASGQEARRIYIVSHGWHTGLVLPVEHLEPELLQALKAFEFWSHVEIGWATRASIAAGTQSLSPLP